MITVRKSEERGGTEIDWLKSKHSFSFGEYYDPGNQGFGPLRVINEDWIKGGAGFPPHPHRDMEIVTYILEGAISRRIPVAAVAPPPPRRNPAHERGQRHHPFRIQRQR